MKRTLAALATLAGCKSDEAPPAPEEMRTPTGTEGPDTSRAYAQVQIGTAGSRSP